MCCLSANVFSWSSNTHGEIAIAVYSMADESARSQILASAKILKTRNISQFDRWANKFGRDYSPLEKSIAWLGVWPDYIRRESLNRFIKHATPKKTAIPIFFDVSDSGRWHYDNSFVNSKGETLTHCEPKNLGRLMEALKQSKKIVADDVEHAVIKAVALSFYIHLVADLYQPMHVLSQADKHCRHDRGGNDTCLVYANKKCRVNVHQFWDRSGYQDITAKKLENHAAYLTLQDTGLEHQDFSELAFEEVKQYNVNQFGSIVYSYTKGAKTVGDVELAYRRRVQQVSLDQLSRSLAHLVTTIQKIIAEPKLMKNKDGTSTSNKPG